MKVCFNGFNLYNQLSSREYLVKEFGVFNIENLIKIEVRSTFAVLLVADIMYLRNRKNVEMCQIMGNISNFTASDDKILALTRDHKLLKINKDDISDIKDITNQIRLENDKIRLISAGSKINIALTEKGQLFQIPNLLSFDCDYRIVDVKTGREHCLILDERGNVYSFGRGR